ncbi:ATP-binding cassette domain-containing protein [bacterium]|nr:ATP-binding cassette domain-containing protein [bacterium]MBU1615709.1 ATP-binding cassette domain-containing protein [bacterium]
MTEPLIRIEDLTKYYGDGPVLDITHLEFEKAKVYCLFGPNGAGKTTLLDILDLLESPTSGRIFFCGQEVNISSLGTRRRMGYVAQDPFLFNKTVFENVFLGLKMRSRRNEKEKVRQILEEVGLTDFEDRRAKDLSGGEAQRVAIARALVHEPEVLFLDEPTANIDRENIRTIEELIKKINKNHRTTIIFTTHNLSQAYRLTEEIVSLINGQMTKNSVTLYSSEV